jgi:hypothetical protein
MTFERSFWMNRFLLLAVSVLALVLSACRGSPTNPDPDLDPDPHPNELAGTYNGEVTVSDAGLFTLTTFTIDNAGNLTGTTTAKDVGDAPKGEKGTITGTIKPASDPIFLEIDLTLESPTLGRFTLRESDGIYAEKNLAASGLTTRDTSGTFIRNGSIITVAKE